MSKHETRSHLVAGGVSEIPLSESRCRSLSGRGPIMGEIGLIGLGRMGTAMAANLAAAGRSVIAYVRRPDQTDRLTALGLRPTTDVGDLLDCEVVITMLPDDDAVLQTVFGHGNDGLAAGLRRGAIHLSMSTISTAAASRLAGEHARLGQRLRGCASVRKSGRCQGAPAIHHRRWRRGRNHALPTDLR